MKQRYDSYKPSGIDWIGDIPSHWKSERLRYVCEFRNGYTPSKANEEYWSDGTIPWYRMEDIRETGRFLKESKQYISAEAVKGCGLFEAGSFILATTATIGEHAMLIVDSLANQRFTNLKIRKSLSHPVTKEFFFYYLYVIDEFCKSTTKTTTFPAMDMTDLRNFGVSIPPLAEQETIAAWLDKKCGEIDAAIAKVDREIGLIDELKQSEISRVVTRGLNPDAPLRPSGIDWVGDIPEHWTKCRFKNFMYLKTKPSCSQVKVGLENLESGSGKFIESDTEFEGNGVEFCHSDILYGKLRPYLRKVWLAEFSGNAVGDFFIFGNYSNSAASYLKYLLLSDGFTKQADGSTFGAKMPRVSSEFILTLPFYLPPLTEQQAIADYLDKKCAEIDGLKAKLTKKRDTLTELRQSIISEVVTGKRKVI